MNNERWIKLMNLGSYLGCHQMPERSFFFYNYQFPLCARCMGVVISFVIAIIVFFSKKVSFILSGFMCFIMFLDWFLQFLNIKQSTNTRRFITGLLGGFGWTIINFKILKFILNKSKFN